MEYLILMTMAGSVLSLVYWIWDRCFHDFLTQSMKYRALIIILLVYLVPWAWLKGIYGYVVYWFLPVRVPVITGHPVAIADIITKEEAYRTSGYWWRLLVVGVWILVALVRVVRKAKISFNNKQMLLDTSDKCESGVILETVERLREELHYKGRLGIYITPDQNTTFTLGAFRPLIFLQEKYSEDQLYLILKHEMMHVKRKDLFIKLLMEFAGCVHWFNYLVHGLNGLLSEVCESSCDERVLKGATEDEEKIYARSLIECCDRLKGNEPSPLHNTPFVSGLVDIVETTAERVNLIMKRKEIKSWKKRLAASVFAGLLVVNSFTAMAYPDVYHVESSSIKAGEDSAEGNAFWLEEPIEEGYKDSEIEVLYEEEFIDMEGNVYPVNASSPYVFCIKHYIVSGYYQTHVKDAKGGCTVNTYESEKCTICNTIWVGDLYKTSTWTKCPH